jgi:hypothetical protein
MASSGERAIEESPARKKSKSNLWVGWGVLGIAGLIGAVGLLLLLIEGFFKGSVPYEMAVEKLMTDERVEAVFGHPIDIGWLVTGSLNVEASGGGQASLRLTLSGPKDRGTAHVSATRTETVWRVTGLTVSATRANQLWDVVGPSP